MEKDNIALLKYASEDDSKINVSYYFGVLVRRDSASSAVTMYVMLYYVNN